MSAHALKGIRLVAAIATLQHEQLHLVVGFGHIKVHNVTNHRARFIPHIASCRPSRQCHSGLGSL